MFSTQDLALFVVPQFIGPQGPNKALGFIALGCLFNANSLLWCHVLVVSFGIKLALAARD